MLNSAVGVTLPGTSTAPPITTSRSSPARTAGARSSASATLVSGPSAINVSGSLARRTASSMKSAASSATATRRLLGCTGRPVGTLAQAVGAVVALGGHQRAPERLGGALGDGGRRRRPTKRQQSKEVHGGVGDPDVTRHRGDPGQAQVGRAPGEEQRQRVVDAGVGVDQAEHRIPMWGYASYTIRYARFRGEGGAMDIEILYCGE